MAFKMKGSPAKMGGIKGTSGHTSALKQHAEASALKQAEASALKEGTDWWDKVKSAGSAVWDNLGKVNPVGHSLTEKIAYDYGEKKKEYRKAAKDKKSSNKMKSPMEQSSDGSYTPKEKSTKSYNDPGMTAEEFKKYWQSQNDGPGWKWDWEEYQALHGGKNPKEGSKTKAPLEQTSPVKDRESRLRKRASKQRAKANVHVDDFSEKGEKKYQKHQGKYKKLLSKADKISSSKE